MNTTLDCKRTNAGSDCDRPCVDAVLAAKGVFHREAPVVELQGWEASLVQAHQLSVRQRQSRTVGVVAWTGAENDTESLVERNK